jgi:hypothetical protein
MNPALSASALLVSLLPALTACTARGAAAEELPPLACEPEAAAPSVVALPDAMRPPRPLDDDGIFYVLGPDPAHPRVRYLDGQLAESESCAVQLGKKLSRRVPPVYVNGRPIGFC